MYQCFHCGCYTVSWDSDCNADEIGYDDENGIVHFCHCENCGAEIIYYIPSDEAKEAMEK